MTRLQILIGLAIVTLIVYILYTRKANNSTNVSLPIINTSNINNIVYPNNTNNGTALHPAVPSNNGNIPNTSPVSFSCENMLGLTEDYYQNQLFVNIDDTKQQISTITDILNINQVNDNTCDINYNVSQRETGPYGPGFTRTFEENRRFTYDLNPLERWEVTSMDDPGSGITVVTPDPISLLPFF